MPNKPFITCHLNGGLGNQLFQIFITLRNALKFNKQIVFMNTTISGRDRNTYWTSLLDKMLDKYILSFNYFDFNLGLCFLFLIYSFILLFMNFKF